MGARKLAHTKTRGREAALVLMGAMFGVILTAGVAGCGEDAQGDDTPPPRPYAEDVTTDSDDRYTLIRINGMPCIKWSERLGSNETHRTYSGLTCDWSPR